MSLEHIIKRILDQRSDLSRESVLGLLEKKKAEAQGLLSDEGAARLVAQDLLVRVDGKTFSEIKIADVVTNLNDVTLTGRVIAQWPLQEFRKQDGTPGKLVRLVLGDRTGRMKCVLWNSKAEQVTAVGELQGRLIRLAHGYTREGMSGIPEFNGGDRCEITVLPLDSRNDDYPDIFEFFTELQELRLNDADVSIIGVVESPPKFSTFSKEDQKGSFLKTTITDGTGAINIVAWNEKAQGLIDLKRGDTLQVIGGRVKADMLGKPEVHLGNNSITSILKEKPLYLKMKLPKFCKIENLQQGKSLSLLVRVVEVGGIREFSGMDGGTRRCGTLLVGDETGLVRLFLWDKLAEFVYEVHVDEIILVGDALAKEKGGELFVSVGGVGKLTRNPQVVGMKVPSCPNPVMLGSLSNLSRPVVIAGVVSGDVVLRNVQIGSNENVKVATLVLTDGSGRARLSLWRDLAERAASLKAGAKIRVVGIQPKSKSTGEVVMSSTGLTVVEVISGEGLREENGKLISDYL